MPGIVLAGAIGLIGAEYAYQDSKTPTVEKLLIPLLMVGVLCLEIAQIGIVKQFDGLHNFFATLAKNIAQVAIQNEFLDRVESTNAYENNPDSFWLLAVSCIIFAKLAGQYAGKIYIQDKELSKREPLSNYLKAGALGVMVSGGVFEFVREQWSTASPVKTASLCLVSEVTIPLASVIQAWSILHSSHEDFEKIAFARQIVTVVAETELNTLSEKGVQLFDSDLSNYLN